MDVPPWGDTNVRAAAFPYQTHALCVGRLTMDSPLQGDTGGHTGAAPTHLHQTTWCVITASHCTFDSPRQTHGVFISHRIAHSIAPNHAVCPYPIGVVLSIAQGWQVQRSLPWVAMQARRLPPWGLYFFPSQHNDCNHTHIGGGNASRTPAPILKIKKCVYRYDFGVTVDDAICFKTSYSFGVTVDDAICFKTSYSFGVTVASP